MKLRDVVVEHMASGKIKRKKFIKYHRQECQLSLYKSLWTRWL